MTAGRWLIAGVFATAIVAFPFFLFLTNSGAQEASTTCSGHQANVVASEDQKVLHGTPDNDFVVIAEGVRYVGEGGTDVVCNEKGVVEYTISFDDTT